MPVRLQLMLIAVRRVRKKFVDFTPAFEAARRAQLKIAVSAKNTTPYDVQHDKRSHRIHHETTRRLERLEIWCTASVRSQARLARHGALDYAATRKCNTLAYNAQRNHKGATQHSWLSDGVPRHRAHASVRGVSTAQPTTFSTACETQHTNLSRVRTGILQVHVAEDAATDTADTAEVYTFL